MSSEDVYREKTPHNLTPKSIKQMVEEVLEGIINVEMFQTMATISLIMGNLGLEVQSLENRLTIMEGEKQGLLKQMKEEHEGYVKYRKCTTNWSKQKMETQERV